MGIRRYKPTTPGRRGASGSDFAELTRDEPEKSLVRPLHGHGGTNAPRQITPRHQSGGAKTAGSAGSGVQLLAKEGRHARLRMPSGEIRLVDAACRATIGEVSNAEQGNFKLGKAGRSRWKGRRPSVRGVAMNPIDHPMGGGEGKTSGGRHPVSPWGKPEGRTRQAP